MMYLIDTNILIYARRGETGLHGRAAARLVALAEGTERWALPIFCVAEFLRVVTHPRVFGPPSTLAQAAAFIEGIVTSPTCEIVLPGPEFLDRLLLAARAADARPSPVGSLGEAFWPGLRRFAVWNDGQGAPLSGSRVHSVEEAGRFGQFDGCVEIEFGCRSSRQMRYQASRALRAVVNGNIRIRGSIAEPTNPRCR